MLWYLSDPTWPSPNLTLLNNALRQTGWRGEPLNEDNWRQAVLQRLRTIVWERVVDDVRPFLEPGVDPNVLNRENLERLLAT